MSVCISPRRVGGGPGTVGIARYALLALLAWCCAACGAPSPQPADAPSQAFRTIGFDLSQLNDDGLRGPPDGLRALHYEFCIPSRKHYEREVKAIDPSAIIHPLSPGRIGCVEHQALVMGSTHQPNFEAILRKLAALPYVTRIEESRFE